jgi:tetratricopeptide (TPR) repeat protein
VDAGPIFLKTICAVTLCGWVCAFVGYSSSHSVTAKAAIASALPTRRAPVLAEVSPQGIGRLPGKPAAQAAQPPEQPVIYAEAIRENNIGMALMEKHEFTQALADFERACILNPGSDTGCLNIGIALLNMGRFDLAGPMLKKSADREPQNPRPWFNLGLMERETGKSDEARADFEHAAALDPEDPDTQYFLGDLAEQSRQYEKAATYFQNTINLDPASTAAEYALSQAEEQMGDASGAKAHQARYLELAANKQASRIRFLYGEQGKYSLAQEMEVPPLRAAPAIPVRFVDVTAISGLPQRVAGRPASARASRTLPPNSLYSKPTLGQFLGSGACIFDYDGDGRPDILLVNADGKGDAGLYRNLGQGRFLDVTKAAKLQFRGEGTGCAVGDYDNDGHPDLAIGSTDGIVLFHNQGDGTFQDVTGTAGVRTEGLVLGLTFLDYDGDGKLDLYVTRFSEFPLDHADQPFLFPDGLKPSANTLWHNQGNGTFEDATDKMGAAGSGPSIAALGTDINNDGATDLVVTGWQKFPALLVNSRDGAFRSLNPWAISMPGPAAGAVAFDFKRDGWMDLAFTHWAPPGISVWRNVGGKSFQRVVLIGPGWMRGWGIAPIDYDNDGWMDLVAVGETFSGEGRMVLFRNQGSAGFRDVTHETGLDKVVLHRPRSVIALDFDGDGATDLLVTENDGPPVLLRNIGGNKNHWLTLGLSGEADNHMGLLARVELSAAAERQQLEFSGGSGYLGQGPATVSAGLGPEGAADVVRIVWPSGAVQDELEVAAGKRVIRQAGQATEP